MDPAVEVRFAIVMYGGSSLAIYMNGVAQELLHMVRATAPARPARAGDGTAEVRAMRPDEDLESTEPVYRAIGRMLPGRDEPESSTIRRRFVVDIITGSSAGGINGIFLGKALANNQSMTKLQELWIREGDIGLLLNDRRSARGVKGLKAANPPPSLLDGRRMYRKLLEALDGMEEEGKRSTCEPTSPLVRELDLYVTATDLAGLPLAMRLDNGLAHELRHRNVFHVAYRTREASGESCNQFHADNNPFFAFVARCTSSLPFAFEPMTLAGAQELLAKTPNWSRRRQFHTPPTEDGPASTWVKTFFPDYDLGSVAGRPFGDGGSLDNSPFTFATRNLRLRHADIPLERKLMYVEPDPADPEDPSGDQGLVPPDAMTNVLEQVVTLPRKQTIKEDLQALSERDRIIGRVNGAIDAVDKALAHSTASEKASRIRRVVQAARCGKKPDPHDPTEWGAQGLAESLEAMGVHYVGYQRLKVESITHDLARQVAVAAGLQEDSDEVATLRLFVAAWRDLTFADDPQTGGEGREARESFNQFLLDFDLDYRLRKIVFLQRRIDKADRLDEASKELLVRAGSSLWPENEDQRRGFRKEIRRLKGVLAGIVCDLRTADRKVRRDTTIGTLLTQTGITQELLIELLKITEEESKDRVDGLVERHRTTLDAVADTIRSHLVPVFKHASDAWKDALRSGDPAGDAARTYLSRLYDRFDDFDMVAFPIQFGTDAGESAPVTVMRISPKDATQMGVDARKKVAGIKYGHFGAFLSCPWRVNDILWGRLDAAECLIKALLPPSETRRCLIEQAFNAILTDSVREHPEPLGTTPGRAASP